MTYHQVRDLIKNRQMGGQIVRKISVEAEVRVQSVHLNDSKAIGVVGVVGIVTVIGVYHKYSRID